MKSVIVCIVAAAALAQNHEPPASAMTPRTIKAVGYPVGGGTTSVDLKSTGLIADAEGKANVEAKPGITTIWAEFQGLLPPIRLGSQFLTYALWAVSPDGRAINLGEVVANSNGKAKLRATTQLQSFSLFVTAEPYWAVRQPSEMLVLENDTRKNTKGRIFVVNNYMLMKRNQYEKLDNPLALGMDLKNIPIEMYEARNALEIAKARGADRYAPEIFAKADGSMKMAENALARKAQKKEIRSLARQTAQFSEDARAMTLELQEQERIERERVEAAAKAKADAEAKAAAEAAEAKRRADREARRQAELAQAREAQMRAEADLAATRAKAEADALRAKEEAAKAEAERARQAAEQLRAQLLEQFNRVLETRDSPRGLVITMADVLFDTGKYNLRMDAREKLARLSGIVAAHPGLALEVEGHTDNVGSEELNQKLSQQRANTVRQYLIAQGLDAAWLTARGFGESMPVASNRDSAGRQKNRRVELIVSGEVIGVRIGK